MAEVDGKWAPVGIDATTPNIARMYDYYLGGKDNFAADRAAAERILEIAPFTPFLAAQNRAFLRRAVHLLAARGIRQFLDVGAGLPTQGNVHQIAHSVVADARVAYTDNDPVVIAHGRALLAAENGETIVAGADLRRPEELLADQCIRRIIDFDQPVGLILNSVLHCLTDGEEPYGAVATLRNALAPGSHLVISHISGDDVLTAAAAEVYRNATTRMVHRTRDQITGFFEGFELLHPGVVTLAAWRPEPAPDRPHPATTATEGDDVGRYFLCGVGRKTSPHPGPRSPGHGRASRPAR